MVDNINDLPILERLLTELPLGSQGPSLTAEVSNHPVRGFEIINQLTNLSDVDFPRNEILKLARIILQHHERIDGVGYPQGLKGGEIEPESQIIAIAELYEALTHKLPNREVLSYKEAMQEIIKLKGTAFSHELIKDLLATFSFYPIGSEVQLSNGQRGRVIKVNEKNPFAPIVEITIDAQGNKLASPVIVDLSQETSLTISK